VPTRVSSPVSPIWGAHWWLLLLRGALAIIFGILAFTKPGLALAGIILGFGIYALVDGVFALIAAFRGWKDREDRWMLVLEGVVGIWAGIVTLNSPAITAIVLVFVIAGWAMATGVLKIVQAVRLRKVIEGEFWLGLSGVLSIVFSFFLLLMPGAGILGLVWYIATFAIVFGAMLVILSFKLRGVQKALA
jgi:uncharacterized membrane protein HdeD (DUF308 family)